MLLLTMCYHRRTQWGPTMESIWNRQNLDVIAHNICATAGAHSGSYGEYLQQRNPSKSRKGKQKADRTNSLCCHCALQVVSGDLESERDERKDKETERTWQPNLWGRSHQQIKSLRDRRPVVLAASKEKVVAIFLAIEA